MAELSEHAKRVFQNLSMPWAQEGTGMLVLPAATNSLTAAEASIGRSSTSSSWLSRKSSFKAAARSIRSVSVTTMAAAVANRSPSHHHHRVSSTKSAKASVMRKNSQTDSMYHGGGGPRKETSAGMLFHSSTTSSLSSQDMSIGMPALESEPDCNVVFDITLTSDDISTQENSSRYGSRVSGDSLLSFDDSSLPSNSGVLIGIEDDSSPVKPGLPTAVQTLVQSCPTSVDAIEENKAYADESEWAKQALKMRRDKGRIDSTSTNEVTFLNTILNKNLTVTDEGNAIRRRIELQSDESPKDKWLPPPPPMEMLLSAAPSSATPPVLTIEPPSPMPTSVSPYCKSYPESDSETATSSFTNTGTNPMQSTASITMTSDDYSAAPDATGASAGWPLMSNETPKRRGRSGHKTSHSFNSVRAIRRPRRSRSSDRSSSEPPQFDLSNVRKRGVADNPNYTNDSSQSSILTSTQNQSYRRLLESNSGSAAATTNNNATLKSGNVAIAGGHGNSRHASGDSSPKGVCSWIGCILATCANRVSLFVFF